MISLSYSMFVYLISLFMFLSCSNSIMFWLVMEINLISFIYLMFSFSSMYMKIMFEEECLFFYFIIQSLGSFIFLFSVYFFEESYIFSDMFFFSSIILKLGIFPLFFWILDLSGSLSILIFTLILTFQKVPMFIIMFNSDTFYVMFILLFSFIYGSFMIFFSFSTFMVLVFSSMSSSFWLYIIYQQGLWFYFIFFFFYSLSMFQFMSTFGTRPNLMSFIFFLFISGIPPMSLFFFKFYICSSTLLSTVKIYFFLFWVLSFMALLGYFKFFYHSFFSCFYLYLKQKFCFKNMSVLVGSMAILAPFLA